MRLTLVGTLLGFQIPFASVSIAGPVCPIEDSAHCQSTSFYLFASDRLLDIRGADDFRPLTGSIDRLCFYPCFRGFTLISQTFYCDGNNGGVPPPDDWVLKIYEDALGIPGALLAGIPIAGLSLTIDAKSPPTGTSLCWTYSAPINPPDGLTIAAGECYWLELTGMGEMQTQGTCITHLLSSRDGNRYSMSDENALYELDDLQREDLAFCLSSAMAGATNPPTSVDGGCGNLPVACCKPQGTCIDGGTFSQCGPTEYYPNGGVPFPYLTCADLNAAGGCPRPPNDLCANAIWPIECQNQTPNPNLGTCSRSHGSPNLYEVCDFTVGDPPAHDCPWQFDPCQPLPPFMPAYRCTIEVDNTLAQTDGPAFPGNGCQSSGQNTFKADIWFQVAVHGFTARKAELMVWVGRGSMR